VHHHSLPRVANGRAGFSPDIAIRLEKTFGGNADYWLRLQAVYNHAEAVIGLESKPLDKYRYVMQPVAKTGLPGKTIFPAVTNFGNSDSPRQAESSGRRP